MRVWLVNEQPNGSCPPLEPALRQLAQHAGDRMTFLGSGMLRPGLVADLRSWQIDLLIVHEPCRLDGPAMQNLLDLDVGVVVVAKTPCERFLTLAETYPVVFVAPAERPEDLWPALLSTWAARRRHLQGKTQLRELQQRFDDRIIIERAKGILVQRLGITEEDAYKRLRVISRRQRRPMRDIAQSLLDAESLLLPETNGFCDSNEFEDQKQLPG